MPINRKTKVRVILLLCITSLASFSTLSQVATHEDQKELLDQPSRNLIYELIKQNPGLHFRIICQSLDKKMGVVQYHLKLLEKANYVRSVRDGRYKCFFDCKSRNIDPELIDPTKETIMDYTITNLRKPTTAKIISHLNQVGQSNHQTLSKIVGISSQAMTYHTKQLEQYKIISSTKVGRKKFYQLSHISRQLLEDILSINN